MFTLQIIYCAINNTKTCVGFLYQKDMFVLSEVDYFGCAGDGNVMET